MKITVLIDNIEDNNCISEWGLSFYIEYNNHVFLLDTGSSSNFIDNANKLRVDLKSVDYGILSHAHYDHSDGMDAFFNLNNKANFYLQKSSKENCYSKRLFSKKYIGIKQGILENFDNRITYVDNVYQICDGVKLIGHSSKGLDNIGVREHMFLKTNTGYVPDCFDHEQSLVFELKDGIIVFNSCSHGGIKNIYNEIKKEYPNSKIIAYFGGLHLFNKKNKEIINLSEDIKKLDIEKIYTGHCTGDNAYMLLKNALKDRIEQFKCGSIYKYDEK